MVEASRATCGLTICVSFQPGIDPCCVCSRWLKPEYLKLARNEASG